MFTCQPLALSACHLVPGGQCPVVISKLFRWRRVPAPAGHIRGKFVCFCFSTPLIQQERSGWSLGGDHSHEGCSVAKACLPGYRIIITEYSLLWGPESIHYRIQLANTAKRPIQPPTYLNMVDGLIFRLFPSQCCGVDQIMTRDTSETRSCGAQKMHQLFNIHFYNVCMWENTFFGTSASYGIAIQCFGHYVELAWLVLFLGGLILHHAPSPPPHG